MIRESPAVKVRQNLGEMLNEVRYKRENGYNHLYFCKRTSA